MNSTAMQFAVTAALAGTLSLAAAAYSTAQVRTGAEGAGHVSQYCVPIKDGQEQHRLYCRDVRG